jgi:hypothetical protein
MKRRDVVGLVWPIVSSALGCLVVINTLIVSGNLADALAGQPPLGDESTAQLVTLLAAGGVLIIGGITAFVMRPPSRRRDPAANNSLASD